MDVCVAFSKNTTDWSITVLDLHIYVHIYIYLQVLMSTHIYIYISHTTQIHLST